MDGYSVNEAASVLGVPVERVWELLARGVLSGTPEGETGMRVFLQPRPAPSEAPLDAPAPRGNGATEPERELSPFRELLTEFRNLTERYGQALLALGESRGEVAALRSRVDLLEARMDLGQPAPAATARPRGWWPGSGPYPGDETVIPTQPPPPRVVPDEQAGTQEDTKAEEQADAEESAEAEEPPESDEHRARPRGPRRATESFAEAIARAQDPSLPDLPEPEPVEAAAAAEPVSEISADADFPRELPAADTMPVAEEEPEASPSEADADGGEPMVAPEPEDAQPVAAAVEATAPQPFETAQPLEWDDERYTTAIEEPDWFEAEADHDVATTADTEPPTDAAVEAERQEGAGEAKPEVVAEPEVDTEEAEATTETEAAAPDEAEAFPGASDLQSALEALGVARVPDESVLEAADEPAVHATPIPGPPPTPSRPPTGIAAPPIPESALRFRPVAPAGPTGRAYRRLRRIFPS